MPVKTFSQDFFDALITDALVPTPPTKESMIAAARAEIQTFVTTPSIDQHRHHIMKSD